MPEGFRPDPLGLVTAGDETITGTVVCAAVIAYAGGTTDSLFKLCSAILGTVVVYWLAHLHAETIGSSLTHHHHPLAALEHSLAETWPIVGAAGVPLAALILSSVLGADLQTAAWIALGVTIALLAAYSYLAGMRGGLDLRGRLACTAAGAGLGLLVVVLKVGLH